VPVELLELVPVALLEPVPVALDEAVPVWLPVPVALLELVPVALLEPVPVALLEPVPVELLEPVPVELLELVPVNEELPVSLPVVDAVDAADNDDVLLLVVLWVLLALDVLVDEMLADELALEVAVSLGNTDLEARVAVALTDAVPLRVTLGVTTPATAGSDTPRRRSPADAVNTMVNAPVEASTRYNVEAVVAYSENAAAAPGASSSRRPVRE
jgi:hypothetical protein